MSMDPLSARIFTTAGVIMFERALGEQDLKFMASAFAGAGRRHTAAPTALAGWLHTHTGLSGIACRLLAKPARLVRFVAVDKRPQANWFVPWHQDRTIAVRRRCDIEGFENWTIKDGVHHVEPPVGLLESMVTLRVHLDDCDETQGPLEVIQGSHRGGRLAKLQINQIVGTEASKLCIADRGDVLAMRPLTVHRSQRAALPGHRRVLHLEYAAGTLPSGLEWSLPEMHSEELPN